MRQVKTGLRLFLSAGVAALLLVSIVAAAGPHAPRVVPTTTSAPASQPAEPDKPYLGE